MEKTTCEGCGKPLVKQRKNQRYHHEGCKQLAYRKRRGTATQAPSQVAPFVTLAGVDTLYLNAYYADPDISVSRRIEKPLDDVIQETLNRLQHQAKTSKQEIETPWEFDKKPLHILGHGTGRMWLWILHSDLVNVQIGTGDYRGVIAHTRVSSEYLWQIGAIHYTLSLVNAFLNRIFDHEMYVVPSKVDLCADIAGWSMNEINRTSFVGRARLVSSQHTEETVIAPTKEIWRGPDLGTLYFGVRQSSVHGKIYDKWQEIKDKGNKKSWFYDLWKRGGWDEQAPVTRVEISFNREALHDLDIETSLDLMHDLKNLWAFGVGSHTGKAWLRYTTPTEDTHKDRWPTHPTWKVVQGAFDTLSDAPARELIRTRKQAANVDAATAGFAGYLSSRTAWWCAQMGISPDRVALETALADAHEDMERLYQDKGVTFQEQVQAKQRRYFLRKAKADAALESKLSRFYIPEIEEEDEYESN